MGDPELTTFEDRITSAKDQRFQAGTKDVRDVFGVPYHVSMIAAHAVAADFIIWDLSPNISTLNRIVLSASNHFIIPCFPELHAGGDHRAFLQAHCARRQCVVPLLPALHLIFSVPSNSYPPSPPSPKPNTSTGGFISFACEMRDYQRQDLDNVVPCRYPLPVIRPVFLGNFMTRFNLAKKGLPPSAIKSWVEKVNYAVSDLKRALSDGLPPVIFKGQQQFARLTPPDGVVPSFTLISQPD